MWQRPPEESPPQRTAYLFHQRAWAKRVAASLHFQHFLLTFNETSSSVEMDVVACQSVQPKSGREEKELELGRLFHGRVLTHKSPSLEESLKKKVVASNEEASSIHVVTGLKKLEEKRRNKG